MLNKTTELFNRVINTAGDMTQEPEYGFKQLGVTYRGSPIIGEDNICDATPKVSGYNTESETAACPGDRAPDIPSLINATDEHQRKTLFSIFSPSHHSVLVFTKTYEEKLAMALSTVVNQVPGNTVRSVLILPSKLNASEIQVGAIYDEVFIDSGDHAYATYGLPSDQSWFVVVRPDGVVGARVHEIAGVERYFQKIFS